MLTLKNERYEVVIENDAGYVSGSTDNLHFYDIEYSLDAKPFIVSSRHSVTVKDGDRVLRS